ncbi:23S rRNA (pseudouridine(1915)-N(3))-methyltransferase RlmH [Terrarubrum flagellatum]|uniref:23S rRNA (pseudouridine(1915)-N(3))-methyltransferase RlmH n=1 Tax=Terrirubrum flagellatum TaxID=2895980 RepID=UPI00314565C8
MRLNLAVVGRMKDGPERELVARYVKRAADAGRALGFSGPDVAEIAESRAPRPEDRRAAEGVSLAKAIGESVIVCLDERGAVLSSEAIAGWLAVKRDGGTKAVAFVIGGADGLSEEMRGKAAAIWSFGAATFPHQIVRILAAEQLYRAMTILAGHPYHRGA